MLARRTGDCRVAKQGCKKKGRQQVPQWSHCEASPVDPVLDKRRKGYGQSTGCVLRKGREEGRGGRMWSQDGGRMEAGWKHSTKHSTKEKKHYVVNVDVAEVDLA